MFVFLELKIRRKKRTRLIMKMSQRRNPDQLPNPQPVHHVLMLPSIFRASFVDSLESLLMLTTC